MPRHDADRNLLFGILALQMDLISRDALIAAMASWALAKDRPLGEILVEAGALDPIDRASLEPMIDHRIARNGGDVAASLAALSSVETVATAIRQTIEDRDVLESISRITAKSHDTYATAQSDPYATAQNDPYATRMPGSDDAPAGVRYQKVRDHAHGGLGVVFVARDAELNREVALKEIQDRHADDRASRARFLLEAEITGGLEHPGIVPVYGLGAYDDGRPFYAMRFIRGDSLKDAIAGFHTDESLKNDPGRRTLELQKLLRRFLDVCNAIEYAHSRGVLHRDLKPDNVMVGKYGETLVVDWGLAKSVDRPEGDWPEAQLTPSSASGSAETLPGSVIGTPAYMSPEQAEGRIDLLGPTSDVYSLGATLYALLTGHAPFEGNDRFEVMAQVKRNQIRRPRDRVRWLDPALEAICLKAMALKPGDRYASTLALAAEIERWLADEPVTAYHEPLTRRTRRWARKHRTAVTTVATAGLVAAALLVVSWNRTQTEANRIEAEALEEIEVADRLAGEAESRSDVSRWGEAIASARRAQGLLDSVKRPSPIRRRVEARLEDLQARERDRRLVRALEDARLLGANTAQDGFDIALKFESYRAAFRGHGIDIETAPVTESVLFVSASPVRGEMVAALDDWAYKEPDPNLRSRLLEITTRADPGLDSAAIREASRRKDKAELRRIAERIDPTKMPRSLLVSLADALIANESAEIAAFLLEPIQKRYPGDFWVNHTLGLALSTSDVPRSDIALRYYTATMALRPESAIPRMSYGSALSAIGDYQGAIVAYQTAIQMQPSLSPAYYNLGEAYYKLGDLDRAIDADRKAIAINPNVGAYFNDLGANLLDRKDIDESMVASRRSIELDPKNPKPYYNLGSAYRDKKDHTAAIAEYRRAIALNPHYRKAYGELGNELLAIGQAQEAISAFVKAKEIDPNIFETHNNLGNAYARVGDLDSAIAAYREALRIKPESFEPLANMSGALLDKGQVSEAIASARRALEINPKAVIVRYNFANGLKTSGDLDSAILEYRRVIEIDPNYAEAHCNLGETLMKKGDFIGSLASYERGHRLGIARPDWKYPSAQWVENGRKLLKLEERLTEVRAGRDHVNAPAEKAMMAQISIFKGFYTTAAEFYSDVLNEVPLLASNPTNSLRYNAACAAAQVGSGKKGKDEPIADDPTRAGWREKARTWLRADLTTWGKILDSKNPQAPPLVSRTLQHWKEDPDLAGIRDEASLAKLPEPERESLRSLWTDVEALRVRAAGAK